jgi:hypothetical protein
MCPIHEGHPPGDHHEWESTNPIQSLSSRAKSRDLRLSLRTSVNGASYRRCNDVMEESEGKNFHKQQDTS